MDLMRFPPVHGEGGKRERERERLKKTALFIQRSIRSALSNGIGSDPALVLTRCTAPAVRSLCQVITPSVWGGGWQGW